MGIDTDHARLSGPRSAFADMYRDNASAVMSFFARRGLEPQTVADLTSETFADAFRSFRTFDPAKGTPRTWLLAIARAVYARHREAIARGDLLFDQLVHQVYLDVEDLEDLAARIDAQAQGRELLERCSQLPELERQAIELVDIDGLSPKEAAASLQISAGVLRVRLFRARAKLRKEQHR